MAAQQPTILTKEQFAHAWGVSPRSVERYIAECGMPKVKIGRSVYLPVPQASHWMQLRIIAGSVRQANPKMSRSEVRIRARAIWLEEQGSDGDFAADFDLDLRTTHNPPF